MDQRATGAIGGTPGARSSDPLPPFGRLLAELRRMRRTSQLDLALRAGTSQRHLSFLENGRAQPSRDMVLALAEALEATLAERRSLFLAAGFAPPEGVAPLPPPPPSSVQEVPPSLRPVLQELIDGYHHLPAVVTDSCSNILIRNEAQQRLTRFLTKGRACGDNGMHLIFHPDGYRRHMVNWETAARDILGWLAHERLAKPADPALETMIDGLLTYPGVQRSWLEEGLAALPSLPLMIFEKKGVRLKLMATALSAGTLVGTPQIPDLRIRVLLPQDEASHIFLWSSLHG